MQRFKNTLCGVLVVLMAICGITACSSSSRKPNERTHEEEEIEETTEEVVATTTMSQDEEIDYVFALFMDVFEDDLSYQEYYFDNNVVVIQNGMSWNSDELIGVEPGYFLIFEVHNNNDFAIDYYVDSIVIDGFQFDLHESVHVEANSMEYIEVPLQFQSLFVFTDYQVVNVSDVSIHSFLMNSETGNLLEDARWFDVISTNSGQAHTIDEQADFDQGIIVYQDDELIIHAVGVGNSRGNVLCYFIIENRSNDSTRFYNISSLGATVDGVFVDEARFISRVDPGRVLITCFRIPNNSVSNINSIVPNFMIQNWNYETTEITLDPINPSDLK